MKKGFVLLASFFSILAGYSAEWRLVWSDEFDKPGRPDPAKWGYEQGFVRNREAQWYQPENCYCSNGWLVLEGRKERRPNPRYRPDVPKANWYASRKEIEYTSGCVVTKGKLSWRYGRFEIKAKITAEGGLWPAIWFVGARERPMPLDRWPACGEVDLMEYYDHSILANLCWAQCGSDSKRVWSKWNTKKMPMARFTKKDPLWAEKWHVWRMDWDEKWIRLFIDGELVNEQELALCRNPGGVGHRYPFQEKMHLLINLALGGTGGKSLKKTHFPSYFLIDYVRVYQRAP